MSVPAWKQAILDRKKKQEKEQRQKEAEEAAYLQALPAWKRAIFSKQKEKNQSLSPTSTLDRTAKTAPVSSTPTVSPNNKWITAVKNIREQTSLNSHRRPAWAKNESTTASQSSQNTSSRPAWAKNESTTASQSSQNTSSRPAWAKNESTTASQSSQNTSSRPAWAKNESTTASQSSQNTSSRPAWAKSGTKTSSFNNFTAQINPSNSSFGSRSGSISTYSKPSQSVPRLGRRESVTVLPDSTTAIKPLSTIPSIPAVSLRLSTSQKKPIIHVQDKRRSFEGSDIEESKLANMPAWKKALIMRRRASVSSEETGKVKSEQTQSSPFPDNINKTVQKQNDRHNYSTTDILPEETTSHDETDSPSVSNDVQSSQQDKQTFISACTTPSPSEPSTQKNENKATVATLHLKTGDKQKTNTKISSLISKTGPATSTKPQATFTKPAVRKIAPRPANASRNTGDKAKTVTVTRSQAENEGPNKLVEKEGVVYRPPIFKEVDEWASVTENDPEFTKLPLWKQALIKRRRSDIAKRSGTITAQPSSQSMTKESPANSASQNKKTDLKRESQQSKPTKIQERNVVNRGQSNLETSSVGRVSSTTPSKNYYTPRKVQPARQAPARPAPSRSAPLPPRVKVEEEEPMFTYSFKKSHKTIDAGSESSDSSDSELEDITLTNIDGSGSDEDDSGIDKGAIVVMSYKVTSNDYALPQRPDNTLPTGNNKNTVAAGHGDENDSTKSILFIDTSNKPHKGLRRVSFSDSQLTVEHSYPKYTYHDYDDIHSDEDDNASSHLPKSISANSGLSHKVHPSLRSSNETDSDVYRYSPSKASPMKPSSSLSTYTPSIINNYSDKLTKHLTGSGLKSPPPPKSPVQAADEPNYVSTGSEDRVNDFYSHLNSDTAALLW